MELGKKIPPCFLQVLHADFTQLPFKSEPCPLQEKPPVQWLL